MMKKIVIFALCLCLLTACSDSSSTSDSSAADNTSNTVEISEAPVNDSLWEDVRFWTISGAYIPIPNGYNADDTSIDGIRSYKGPNDSSLFISKKVSKVDITEDFAKKELDELKSGDDSWGTTFDYSNKASKIISIDDKPAAMISYHAKASNKDNVQEWNKLELFVNGDDATIEISLSGDLIGSGNFKKFCDLIELPGVKNAKDISFDDVNYVEVDDLMIPIPKSFEVKSERDFDGENCNIHYYSTSELYDLSEYGMNKEVDKLKEGYNEPDAGMFQDNEVHSSKLDFIDGKMAYYISYTAKIKDSADDKDPTVVEHIDIYINSSKQGVNIMLSGDMTKESNFKAFCEKVKYK